MNKRYARYLRSEGWARKIAAIRERSKCICERCGWNEMHAVHHLTYANIYDEPLDDLLAVCDACHRYIHSKSAYDPLPRLIHQKRQLKAWQWEYYDNLALIEGV